MIISQKSKVPERISSKFNGAGKNQKYIAKIKNLTICIVVLYFAICNLHSHIYAISPTITPKLSPTSIASPSATLTPASPTGGPTGAEDEKVQEIRQAIKDKLNQIKEKIEKKAYVGVVSEITDSTLTITNFRGKQRVRLTEGATAVIGANKKEIAFKDLAVDDKVIALGEPDNNEVLDAKRVVVVPPPKTTPAKRLLFFGTITEINTKTATLALTGVKNLDQILTVKTDKTTFFVNQKDPKTELKFKDLAENQKLLVVYPEPAEGKALIAKTLFLLP